MCRLYANTTRFIHGTRGSPETVVRAGPETSPLWVLRDDCTFCSTNSHFGFCMQICVVCQSLALAVILPTPIHFIKNSPK